MKKFALLDKNHSFWAVLSALGDFFRVLGCIRAVLGEFCTVWELVWRAPFGLVGLAAVPVGGGGAWPGFETTRRAELAARTARGRAAAHGHIKQPGSAGYTKQNLRNWEASRPTARSAGNAILKSPGRPQCRRRNAPRALPGMTR